MEIRRTAGDYLNCPLNRAEYERFVGRIAGRARRSSRISRTTCRISRRVCPIEEIARRGPRHAALRPHEADGPEDPRTGRRPWAVVQLRQENLRADSYNLVGFQNHLRFARTEANSAPDSRPRRSGVSALRADPSQHLHQRPRACLRHPATARATEGILRRARFRAWRDMWNRSRQGWRRGCSRLPGAAKRLGRCRAKRRSARCAITSPTRIRSIISRPTSLSICFPCPSPIRATARRRQTAICRLALAKLEEYAGGVCLSYTNSAIDEFLARLRAAQRFAPYSPQLRCAI